MTNTKHRNGFTLLELSIVLVIIALMIAAVFTARSVIRASQIRSVLAEYDNYLKAIGEFQDKYLALPGDFNNAESIWGSDPGGCPNTASDNTLKSTTCNGDGSGTIGSSTTAASLTNTREWFRAWQQLADAGFITGRYTGTVGGGGVLEANPGVNVPASKLNGAGWTLTYFLLTSNGGLWGDQYGHLLNLGAFTATSYTISPVLTPAEALSLDTKIDDGKPGRGKMRAWRTSVLANCTTGDTTQDAQTYNATLDSIACSAVFLLGF